MFKTKKKGSMKDLLTEKFMDILKFTVDFFFMGEKEEVGVG